MRFSSNKLEIKTSANYQDVKYLLHNYLIAEIEVDHIDILALSKQQIITYVSAKVMKYVSQVDYVVNAHDVAKLTTEMVDEISGLGPLEQLIQNDQIDDILVNGANRIFVEQNGQLLLTDLRFIDEEHVLRVIRRILAPLGRRVDESSPLVDARLQDGSRVNAIVPPLALNGSCLSIRKFRKEPFTNDDLIAFKTLNRAMLDFLLNAAEHKINIMISGGTGSGKTTLLNLLSRAIPINERIVTIEDAAELRLNHDHVVRLETRPNNLEGVGEVTARDLVRNSLRMRPDRIILGEVRGDEVMDVLQAMNTGHEGSMSTIHANNPTEALLRMEMLAGLAGFQGAELTLRKMIAASIDILVQVSRLPSGERKVTSIAEIVGVRDDMFVVNELFSYGASEKDFVAHKVSVINPKLKALVRGD
jgi:pilus assembly protein CpaF